MKIEKHITNLETYPQNGKHQKCIVDGLPFYFTKGENPFYWEDKNGKIYQYNNYTDPNKVDERWVIFIDEKKSALYIRKNFEIKANKDLDKLIAYGIKLYKKTLIFEIKKFNKNFPEQKISIK